MNYDDNTGQNKHTKNGGSVTESGVDERGIPSHICDIYIGLVLDEQRHDVYVASAGCHVQWSRSTLNLPIDRYTLSDELVGLFRLSIPTGIIKFGTIRQIVRDTVMLVLPGPHARNLVFFAAHSGVSTGLHKVANSL